MSTDYPTFDEQVPFNEEDSPFENAEFVENPEPRCPCVLLLDTSSSMKGQPIKELNDGLAFFGVRACGVTCEILQGLQIRDFNGGTLNDGFNDYVLADAYNISVNVVPIPAAVWLFGTALIGLVAVSNRRLQA